MPETKVRESQKKARDAWNKKQAQIAIRIKPEFKERFDEHCKSRGESLAAFVKRACLNQIENDKLNETK